MNHFLGTTMACAEKGAWEKNHPNIPPTSGNLSVAGNGERRADMLRFRNPLDWGGTPCSRVKTICRNETINPVTVQYKSRFGNINEIALAWHCPLQQHVGLIFHKAWHVGKLYVANVIVHFGFKRGMCRVPGQEWRTEWENLKRKTRGLEMGHVWYRPFPHPSNRRPNQNEGQGFVMTEHWFAIF